MRFVVFFAVLGLLLGGLNWYLARWLTEAFGLSTKARRRLRWALVASLCCFILGRWLARAVPAAWVFVTAGSTVELIVLITIALLLPVDLGLLAFRGVTKVLAWTRARGAAVAPQALEEAASPVALSPPGEPTTDVELGAGVPVAPRDNAVTRRALFGQAAAGSSLLIASSSSLYGVLAGRHDYQTVDVPFRLEGMSPKLDGFTIVQLSDIHIGDYTGEAELAAALDRVALAKPDLIVLTGDLLDRDPKLAPELGRFARRLGELCRRGVVAIPGNHDLFAGVDAPMKALHAAGARVLRNTGTLIGDAGAQFALLGVDDVQGPRFDEPGPDLAAAQRHTPQSRDLPSILLCHNPSYFEEAAGSVQLQMSGHTHGGQINPGIRPADWLLPHGWVAGMYEYGGSQLYVNRGFGTVGPPARIGAPPEVTRYILQA